MWTATALIGMALGVAARLVDGIAPRWVGNVGAVWFFAAFLVGRMQEDRKAGASGGALCLGVACVTYYAWRVTVDGTISIRYLLSVGAMWLVASVITGVVGGALGSAARTIAHPWGVAAGVLIGEGFAVLLLSRRLVQPAIELAAGAALLLLPVGVRRTWFAAAVTSVVVAVVAIAYRLALR